MTLMNLPCSSVSPRPLAIPPAATSQFLQSPAESMSVVGGETVECQSIVGGEWQSVVCGVTVESQPVVGGECQSANGYGHVTAHTRHMTRDM